MSTKRIKATASLRVVSRTLTARDIGELLDSTATRAFEQGELMSPRNPKSAIRDAAVWILEARPQGDATLEALLEQLASFVDANIARLLELSRNVSFDYCCGLFFSDFDGQGSIAIPNALAAKLLRIPASFILDVYYPSADELTNVKKHDA